MDTQTLMNIELWSPRYDAKCVTPLPRMGATCSNCGSTNSKTVKVTSNGKVVKTYWECQDCGHIW